jgi:uncharacterized protein (TIGR00369 family)
MPYVDELRAMLESSPKPVCAALTPFELTEADASGRVVVRFPAQPAFGNHFGNVQGGFLVAMLEVPLTLAIFARTRRFLPTIEIKTSFVAAAPIAELVGEATVLRAGASLVFAEARILTADGKICAHATATSLAATKPAG